MSKRLITLFMMGCGALGAMAQSFNVDINNSGGLGAGVPAASFGGAAGQPGVWNNINVGTPLTTTLVNLDGSPSTVTFTRNNVGTFDDASDIDTSGDYDKLLEDFLYSDSSDMLFTFGNLPFGTYALYTYAWTPNSTSEATVNLPASSSTQTQYIGGALTSNRLEPGISHAIHIVSVGLGGGSIQVRVVGFGSFGNGRCNGLQLRKIDSNRLRFHVDANSGSNVDGTSWASAFTSLQTPLVYAETIGGDDVEIWVANGFYRPTTGASRSASFVIPDGLHLYGNFAGTESAVEDRPAGLINATYLTGSIGGAGATDNSYHVIDASGTTGDTTIDGFYIVSGYANGGGEDSKGGGAYIDAGSPDFINCSFSGNEASVNGGAVYNRSGSPSFVGCTFYNNSTNGEGGAIYHTTGGTAYILNCRFLGNHATGSGGALKVSFTNANAFGCLFSGNTVSGGSGGAVSTAGIAGDSVSLVNCTVSLNSNSGGSTGGVHVNKGVGSGVPTLEVHNCILWGNTDNLGGPVQDQNLDSQNGAIINRTYTTVQGLHANPLFVDANGANNTPGDFDDDCRLMMNSPVIDAGDNGKVWIDAYDLDGDNNTFEPLPFDLDGKVRRYDVIAVANTGAGTGAVDRGAYEYSFKKGDMNCDGVVDFFDIDPLVLAFSGQSAFNAEYPLCVWQNGDTNCDGTVDFFDIDPFVECLDGFCSCP